MMAAAASPAVTLGDVLVSTTRATSLESTAQPARDLLLEVGGRGVTVRPPSVTTGFLGFAGDDAPRAVFQSMKYPIAYVRTIAS